MEAMKIKHSYVAKRNAFLNFRLADAEIHAQVSALRRWFNSALCRALQAFWVSLVLLKWPPCAMFGRGSW
ncbi:hypothetical protein TB1_017762 [Malus domestica]